MSKKLISFFTVVLFLFTLVPSGVSALVNTREMIFDINSGFFSTTGGWGGSTAVQGYEGSATNYGHTEDATGTFQPELLYGGIYKISIWNVIHTTNTPDVKVEVTDKNGVHEFHYNNKEGEAGFIELGEFEFEAGNGGKITLSRNGEGFIRLSCVKYELVQRGEGGEVLVPGTGQEEPYPDYAVRSIPQKTAAIPETKANAEKIFVRPGAAGDGSEQNPFGTLAEAQNKVRTLIQNGYPDNGVGVYLYGGTYELDDTLTFTKADAGTPASPVIWQAVKGEAVSLTGGKTLKKENFQLVTDSGVLTRIPSEGKGNVYETDLGLTGIFDVPEMNLRNSVPYVFVIGDKAGKVARWPNEGYGKTGDLVDSSSRGDSGPRKKGFTYEISDPRPLRWTQADNVWFNGYWMTPYTIDYARLSILDTDHMKFSGKEYNGLGSYGGARYYAENLLEEIDQPGEWFLDTKSNKFYLYPYEGWEQEPMKLASKNFDIVKFEGCSNVIIRDLKLEVAGGNGVTIDGASSGCAMIGGEISNVSGAGASVNGTNNYVRDVDISYTGTVGITVTGGDQFHLVQGGNYAENNRIHDTGTGGGAKQGITISGCGNRVSNNHVYNTPTHSITGGGMENIIEYNIVERNNMEMGDTGGIYFLNYGMGYGSKIRYNIVRDSVGLMAIPGFSGEGALGIYLDDMTSGVEVTGNLVINAKETGIFGHGGRYLNIHNNILINNEGGIRVVKTGIEKNLALDGAAGTNIQKFAYDEEPFASRYPMVGENLTDQFGEPKYNIVKNNVSYNSGPATIASVVENGGTAENNLNLEGPAPTQATDFLDFDYTEIKKLIPDFVELPFDQMGIYTGGARTSTETLVFDNRAEPFDLTYPQNGQQDVDPEITLKWTAGKGGIRQNTIYIAEDGQFENLVDLGNITNSTYDTVLDYGKTYYWRVKAIPMQGYAPRWNANGVFSFTTMTAEEKLQGEILSLRALANSTDEGMQEGNVAVGSQSALLSALSEAEAVAEGTDPEEKKEAISRLKQAREAYLASMLPNTKELSTFVYDDFSLDTVGQRPLGFFFRSYSPLNVSVQKDPLDAMNQVVMFQDEHPTRHYGMRYFDSQTSYVEAGVSVMAAQTNGAFSVSLMKTGVYPVESGVIHNNAAKVVFGTDGNLYADKAKNVKLLAYEANKWYDIKIALRLYDKTYDVFVNGEKKAEGVPMDDPAVKAVNQIVLDTTDGSAAGEEAKGTFYVDHTIVKAPTSPGKNPYLMSLKVNGAELEGFEPAKMIYRSALSAQELKDADITYESGKNAKVTLWNGETGVYMTVISADKLRAFTYFIKAK